MIFCIPPVQTKTINNPIYITITTGIKTPTQILFSTQIRAKTACFVGLVTIHLSGIKCVMVVQIHAQAACLVGLVAGYPFSC